MTSAGEEKKAEQYKVKESKSKVKYGYWRTDK
jgi:hypothetical protein